jgi:hypothetical protein
MGPHDQHHDGHDEERSPWSKPSVMLSGMFVLALLVAGIAFLVLHNGNSRNHATAPRSTPTPGGGTASTTPSGSTSGCTLPAGSQRTPSTAPPDGTTWQQVGSMQTPQAPSTLGPQRTTGVWNTCFAHSPSGALLAAFNLWAEGTAASPTAVAKHLAVGAPSNLGNNERLDSGGPVQFAGYKYESYTPSSARMLVVIRGPQGKLGAAATTMRWVGDDWRYVFPPSGQLAFQVIPDLSGYVTWSAF